MKYYFGYMAAFHGDPIPCKWPEDEGVMIGPRIDQLMRIEITEEEFYSLPLAYFMGKFPYKPDVGLH